MGNNSNNPLRAEGPAARYDSFYAGRCRLRRIKAIRLELAEVHLRLERNRQWGVHRIRSGLLRKPTRAAKWHDVAADSCQFKILSSVLPATRAKEKGELPCFLR